MTTGNVHFQSSTEKMKKAYFGIKFYEDRGNRSEIESIITVLRRAGIQTVCMASDVEKWGTVCLPLKELMERTFAEIDQADLVVLEMSEKGVGLGIEAGYAVAKGKQLVVLIKEGHELSGTMQGIADLVISYNQPEEISILKLVKPQTVTNPGNTSCQPSLPNPSFSKQLSRAEVANKYRVDDIAGALIPGSRLSNILNELELDRHISENGQEFLRSKGLLALRRYARKEIIFAEYLKEAEQSQSERQLVARNKALKDEAEQKRKEEAMFAEMKLAQERIAAEKRALKKDPKNIAKAKQFKLRQKYNLDHFIEKTDFPRLMDILRRVDNRQRLTEDDVLWLTTGGEAYYTSELREGYHKNEAEFHAGEFRKGKDPWSAVNASSHYRKCSEAETADSLLRTMDLSRLKDQKLKSAVCTTHGGVKRDLHEWDNALALGAQAHELTPRNFRPCTLLGAVNMEIGNHDLGQSWYEKAVARGYSERAMDEDIRTIFFRAEKSKQEALRDHLLKIDPHRYSWAKRTPGRKVADLH